MSVVFGNKSGGFEPFAFIEDDMFKLFAMQAHIGYANVDFQIEYCRLWRPRRFCTIVYRCVANYFFARANECFFRRPSPKIWLLNIKAMRTAKTYFMVFSPYLDTIFRYISTMLGKGEPSKYAKEIMDYLEKKSLMLALPDFRNAFETLKTKRAELFIYGWILNFSKQIVPSFFSSRRDHGKIGPSQENASVERKQNMSAY
ncbi:hypothetical protein Aduo_009551 [Ancylostoma duodenale]